MLGNAYHGSIVCIEAVVKFSYREFLAPGIKGSGAGLEANHKGCH